MFVQCTHHNKLLLNISIRNSELIDSRCLSGFGSYLKSLLVKSFVFREHLKL